MGPFRPKVRWRAVVAGLGLLACLAPAPPAWSQHTPDPYNGVGEYNGALEPFWYASYPNALGFVPNQGTLTGTRPAGGSASNQFQNYLNNLDGANVAGGGYQASSVRRSGPGVPYYDAYRQNNLQSQRAFAPNARDQDLAKAEEARNEKYFQYLRERDPKKRAQLYREYQQERGRIARDLSGARTGAARGAAPAPRPPATEGPATGTRRGSSASGYTAPGLDRGARSTRPTPSSLLSPRASGDLGPSAGASPSELLHRSESMDRANRAGGRTAPSTRPRRDRAPDPSAPDLLP
jgi:hypothetical protein